MSIVTQGYGPSGVGGGGFEIDAVRFSQVTDVEMTLRELDAEVDSVEIGEADVYTLEIEAELQLPHLDAEIDDNC